MKHDLLKRASGPGVALQHSALQLGIPYVAFCRGAERREWVMNVALAQSLQYLGQLQLLSRDTANLLWVWLIRFFDDILVIAWLLTGFACSLLLCICLCVWLAVADRARLMADSCHTLYEQQAQDVLRMFFPEVFEKPNSLDAVGLNWDGGGESE